MAAILHGESRRMYSWWWDSHISPKNSKWLQENLTDMDRNVKAMIKLIEEDADSFARRAEMYYKKRPELMKLVEEFYRAYRALAERYDHATGALRQAHRTMAEAFPNQIPPIMSDESPSSSGSDIGPHTPEMPSPMRPPLDLEDLQKETLGVSSHFHARRGGVYADENDLLSRKQGLKQLKDLFPSGEGQTRAKFSEGKVRKVLHFKEEEGRVEEKEDLKIQLKRLQEEVVQLSTRNANLVSEMALESRHAQNLEGAIFKLDSVKESAVLQYKLSVERISSLETDISNTRYELNKVNDVMVAKLQSVEEQCLAMEEANRSLQLELKTQQNELGKKAKELKELTTSIAEEHQKRMEVEMALMSLEQMHMYSQKESELLVMEIQHLNEKLKDVELMKVGLEMKISELKEVVFNLNEQNISFDVKIKELQDEMKLLREAKEKLEHELGTYLEENKALQEELCCLKEDKKDMELKHQGLTEQMEVVLEKNAVVENSLSDANVELEGLREKANALEVSCETLLCEVSTHAVEKGVLVSQVEIMAHNMERLTEKTTLLEKSLFDANSELEGLRIKFKDLEECCMSLCDQNSSLLAEKNTLVSQRDNLESKHLELQDQHLNLEKENNSTMQQVMELQSSLRLEKQEHKALISSLSSQLSSVHNQIYVMREEVRIKSENFEMEQQKVMDYLFEIFILQRCLCDMKDNNLFLFGECQNLLEASRCAEDEIFKLKHKELIQKKAITSLSEQSDALTKGIRLLLEVLSVDLNGTVDDIPDEVLLQTIIGEVNYLMKSISNARDENQQLHFEVVNLKNTYLTLQDQHANLELDKDSRVNQIMDLESCLRLEKQEHEAHVLSFSSQLASLQNQVHLLEEEIRVRDDELEAEQQKTVDADLEKFVLQRCLCDMKDESLFLSGECQNILEELLCAERHISELEHKELVQKKEQTLLSNHSEILQARITLLLEAFHIDMKKRATDDPTDQVVWQTILDEIKNLHNYIFVAHDEILRLQLELLVLVTLLKQGGVDKSHLLHELESRKNELLVIMSEKHTVVEMNEQLKSEKDLLASQVEILRHNLDLLEAKHSELNHRKSLLEREKNSACNRVFELEGLLKLEKQEHHARFLSSKSQIAFLETQLDRFEKEQLVKEDEFEKEHQRAMETLLENFILQRFLCDIEDVNLVLFEEYQKRCSRNSELEHMNILLEREKNSASHRVLELDGLLKLEKQEHHALFLSSKSQIAFLQTQLDRFEEEKLVKEDEFEKEHQRAMDTLLENFILQIWLCDIKDVNLVLFREYQKFLEASRCSDLLVSELAHKLLIQEKEMMLISKASENLRSTISVLLKELNVNEECGSIECGSIDGAKMDTLRETLIGEIRTMLKSVSNAQEETEHLHLEISVLVTLLKHIGLEKVNLHDKLARRNEDVLLLQDKNDETMEINERLKSETKVLGEQFSQLHVSHCQSQAEFCNLLEEKRSLLKRFNNLNENTDALEVENSDLLTEALMLDHLSVFFKSMSTERGLELKLSSDDMYRIVAAKDSLVEEIRIQNEGMKQLELEIVNLKELAVLLEFDLNMSRNFCEEFKCQVEASEGLLIQKDTLLSEAQKENSELCRRLEDLYKDLDGARVILKEQDEMINTLSLDIISKDEEITNVLETNGFLRNELDKLKGEFDMLRRREGSLSSELEKETSEVRKCEEEIQSLLNEVQISTVNAAIFEEKVLELVGACESHGISSMLQREMFGEKIVSTTTCVAELKKKIDELEQENDALKANLNAYSPLLMSVFDGVACVEEHLFSLGKFQEGQVDHVVATPQNNSRQLCENASTPGKSGILDLQKLIAKVGTLDRTIIDLNNLLEQERLRSTANIDAARKEIKELKLNQILFQETSREKHGQTMKDIQLDQASSSCISTYGGNKNENTESVDQMLELWEAAERDDIEAVEEVKSEYPSSELIAEKELSIDKLEVCSRFKESPREWNNRFIEKLESDAQRISAVQTSLQEIKTKLECSERRKRSKTSKYATLKLQLKDAEEAVLEQVDILSNLKKKVEDNFESSSSVIWEKERRQISEQARRGSETIGKLELELQKIEYIFLKVEEEADNEKTGYGEKKSSILLSEHIYGKKNGKAKRKGRFCGCMRPKTKG